MGELFDRKIDEFKMVTNYGVKRIDYRYSTGNPGNSSDSSEKSCNSRDLRSSFESKRSSSSSKSAAKSSNTDFRFLFFCASGALASCAVVQNNQ